MSENSCDILFTGGEVIDGTGEKRVRADEADRRAHQRDR